ncbi:MAG: hypothetical protein UY18_C0036G0008, partial [Microgenomates group bacterium GW2011_GWF2_47_9]
MQRRFRIDVIILQTAQGFEFIKVKGIIIAAQVIQIAVIESIIVVFLR